MYNDDALFVEFFAKRNAHIALPARSAAAVCSAGGCSRNRRAKAETVGATNAFRGNSGPDERVGGQRRRLPPPGPRGSMAARVLKIFREKNNLEL